MPELGLVQYFCKFSSGRQLEHPLPCYVHSSHGWSKHRNWESCSESRGFPTALQALHCRNLALPFLLPIRKGLTFGAKMRRSREGTHPWVQAGLYHVEQFLSLILQQKNISLLVLLALLDLVFGSW